MPRHPPSALRNLTQHKNQARPPAPHRHQRTDKIAIQKNYQTHPTEMEHVRCSRPLCSSQPTTRHHQTRTPTGIPTQAAPQATTARRERPATRKTATSPIPQDPTACTPTPPNTSHSTPTPKGRQYQTSTRKHQACRRSTLEPLTNPSWNRPASVLQDQNSPERLLRKEVIQPHLPVRLPCYDLVPITSPTFDGSLPKVGPPASGVTDFRDLTGGVYKARERIHRSVADLRLLATPTSWGRVADPNPN